jgi:hypothetical protein
MQKISYKDWLPPLECADLTMADVLNTLPANKAEEISQIVKLFENPKSPIAFKGAVNLARHDCIHIILARGLLNQDEAFVIGFTMGTSKEISVLEEFLFKQISMRLYPKTYRFSREHLKAYKIGLELGKECLVSKIYEFPFENYKNEKISNLRTMLGISSDDLKKAFAAEKLQIQNSKASERLLK